MTGLEDRLADFTAKLRLQAERVGHQQPADSHSDARMREALAKWHRRIADDLQGLLEPTLPRSKAASATIPGLRHGLDSLLTSVSILQQHLAKLETAPGSVQGTVLPANVLDILNAKTQALGRELASCCKEIGTGLAAFGISVE